MPGRHKLLQNALILDTETLGIDRGAGVHELAIYNLDSQSLHEYILKPNMVQVAAATAQENTRLATSSMDAHKLIRKDRWWDIIKETLLMDRQILPTASDLEVEKALNTATPWLARRLETYPHLLGRVESSSERQKRLEILRAQGNVKTFTSQTISVEDLLRKGGTLEQAIQGKIIWGANVNFEAKQIGALVGGLEAEGIATNLKGNLQTAGPNTDPFYTTGVLVNKAKVAAQQSGDWTGVWKAMLADVPQAGETAVRDIQDVIRSMMSYGQKLGLTAAGDVYWGTSLDVVYRLMGSLEDNGAEFLKRKEVHRAAEDVAIHSQYVLERALRWTSALQEVEEGTDAGKSLVQQALQKKGDYYEAATFLARQQMMKEDINQQSLVQRLARAKQDFIERGKTWQVDGWKQVNRLTQQTPSGEVVHLPILQPNRVAMNSMDEVVRLLVSQGRYGSEETIGRELLNMNQALAEATNPQEQQKRLAAYLDQKTSGVLEGQIEAKAQQILSTYNNNLGKTVTRSSVSKNIIGKIPELPQGKFATGLAAFGIGAGLLSQMGAIWSMVSGNAKATRDQPSLLTYNYDQWLTHQSEMYGLRPANEQDQGMSERGWAGLTRRSVTDFGSPYQGIMGSQVVFEQQELLKEREKWLREQYGSVHYDPMSGLFGMQGVLSRARHQGYAFIPDGSPVGDGYQNLRGKNLMKVNLGDGNWKINVEDADTIVLKRGGLRGIVGSIFGMNEEYSFRLAGVDAPETAHEGRMAQPSAQNSLEALRSYLNNGSGVELVFDPEQTTYGRTMAVMFSGGKNVNYELIKRGWAGFLPYGKPSDSMIDYQIMRGMETNAAGSSRGMWQHPYWKVLYDTTKGGDRPTFNTLVRKEKVVENIATMNMVSLMDQAQALGMYNTELAMEAASIAETRHRGIDQVKPSLMTGSISAHYDAYMNQMLSQNAQWMMNHGSKRRDKHFSARGNYRNYDKALVLDTMGHTNSIWSRRRLKAFDNYGDGRSMNSARKARMQMAQQSINNTIFESKQNHTNYS